MYNLYKINDNLSNVEVCYNEACIKADGKYADQISSAIVVMLLLIGLAAIIKAN